MKIIDLDVYTLKDISDEKTARSFFEKLESLMIEPEYISRCEPISGKYRIDDAVSLWTKEYDGCWDMEKNMMVGKAGSMMARNRRLSITYMMGWWRCASKKSVKRQINHISLYISVTKYKFVKKQMDELFRYLIDLTDAVYGYVSHSDAKERQHVTGTIKTRIPGMFWCNYFSNLYVDFFGREKIEQSSLFQIEQVNNKGLIIKMGDDPCGKILLNSNEEEMAKKYLGINSFGNREEDAINRRRDQRRWEHHEFDQKKIVPKLD